ncbi:MAG: Na+/H+ antiporter NhaC family protein [Phormidesmis sp.]
MPSILMVNPQKNNLDLIAVLFVSSGLLVASALTHTFIAYPLLVALGLFTAVLTRRGFLLSSLLKMGLAGARQALPVIHVLLLIGILTAVWMAAGTVPALVYYGTGLISAQFFILWAFLLMGAVSVLMGTSFGAVGTLGVALMVIARSSNIDVNPVAGAIIAGAFVGDRCSPLSSSAHLVASITRTSLYRNLGNMVASGLWPAALSVVFYAALSFAYPATLDANSVITELPKRFDLSFVVLLPAIALLLLALLRVNVKRAMLVSVGLGIAIAYTHQHYSFAEIMRFLLFGFHLDQDSPLQTILLGGGLFPMAKATLVVSLSTAFAGIFAGSGVLGFVDHWLKHIRTQRGLSWATVFVSVLANLFGCTQTIAILLTGQIMQPHYTAYWLQHPTKVSSSEQLALALEDTAVVIAPLIPWNIAGLIPATVLGVGPGFIPYAVYLLLLPLCFVFRNRPAP